MWMKCVLLIVAMAWLPCAISGQPVEKSDSELVHISRSIEAFPDTWISVGGSIVGANLLERLRSAFPQSYRKDPDGRWSDVSLCVHSRLGYVTVRSNEFGFGLDLEKKMPASQICGEADSSWDRYLTLDSGLQLGQRKDHVERQLGVGQLSNRTSIDSSEEIVQGDQHMLRVLMLYVEFKSDVLVRVRLADMRE
jgi:hypothetical protein